MTQMSLWEGLDQGVPLPPAPQSSPVGWIPPLEVPPPLLPLPGPIRRSPRYQQVRATPLGQRCRPSRRSRQLKRRAIEEFLQIEETQGTMEAVRLVGEELAMHHITVLHNLFDCLNCDPWSFPVKVCRENRMHPDHPLHSCWNPEACGCPEL